MTILKLTQFSVMAMSLTLVACGGGSSGGSTVSSDTPTSTTESTPATTQMSFSAVADEMFKAGENSEPMDISNATINYDTDETDSAATYQNFDSGS